MARKLWRQASKLASSPFVCLVHDILHPPTPPAAAHARTPATHIHTDPSFSVRVYSSSSATKPLDGQHSSFAQTTPSRTAASQTHAHVIPSFLPGPALVSMLLRPLPLPASCSIPLSLASPTQTPSPRRAGSNPFRSPLLHPPVPSTSVAAISDNSPACDGGRNPLDIHCLLPTFPSRFTA